MKTHQNNKKLHILMRFFKMRKELSGKSLVFPFRVFKGKIKKPPVLFEPSGN